MAKGLFDCTGKVTLVTGGNGGIGLGFAMGCAKQGGDVAIWARNAEKNAAAKEALLARDYNRLLDLGGNVYFLSKLFSSDGLPFAEAVSTMTDMTWPEYRQMMLDGGRKPEGNRSIKANRAAEGATDSKGTY